MPIVGLTDRGMAFPQIGDIRKGEPKGENQPGKDLRWFRVEFDATEKQAAQDFTALYDDKPNGIVIILPFDEIGLVWDAWREAYTAGAMNHRCDGEHVVYAINPKSGEIVVRGGIDLATGQTVECKLKDFPDKMKRCKPVGRLSVVIPQLKRLAYLVVHTTSIHDILNISRQLEAIRDLNGGHIAGIPLVLSRKPYKISTPSGKDGQRARREKWLISIEADPTWVAAKIDQMRAFALPAPVAQQVTDMPKPGGPNLADLSDYDEDENGDSSPDPSDQPAPEPEARPSAEPTPAPAAAPASAPAPQPVKPRKLAKVAGSADKAFRTAADEWVKRYPRYAGQGDHADYNHILAAALLEGYMEITVDNIRAVLEQVAQRHAIETQAEEAA